MNASENSAGIDTGALLELLGNTTMGSTFKEKVINDPDLENFYLSPLTVAELLYLLGRKEGFSSAQQTVTDFLKPFIICDEKELRSEAARLKTDHAISLADCYVLAIGIVKKIPIYIKRESEIEDVILLVSKTIDIHFIDDL
ncbi:MAG TPA: PIN domain-containing protein [Candidatus Lokiarchaeia archaeon]|nr:PIN domain-containing protein [Candidatus Lokiarchaeia archaeon]